MDVLTTIEKVMFLRGVEPFSSCRAEEAVRLAAIAAERGFEARETIYEADAEAQACLCLVEGRVTLARAGSEPRTVEAPATIGLLEILSGRRREETATVTSEDGARMLVIEAEDLFDLLSNNIEIVKSLFRALLGGGR
jgi:CRP-like cAMP-binding protein